MFVTMEIAGSEVRFEFGQTEAVLAELRDVVSQIEATMSNAGNGHKAPKPAPRKKAELACPECGRTFGSAAGRSGHIRIVHQGQRPKRKKKV